MLLPIHTYPKSLLPYSLLYDIFKCIHKLIYHTHAQNVRRNKMKKRV